VLALAAAKGVTPSEIGVCVLDRPRHAGIIESLRGIGARVHLITDGDVAGVIYTTDPETGIDLYLGQGGAPEGVLAAAALKCVGGQFQGRLVFRNEDEKGRAKRIGITDFNRKYDLNQLVSTDVVFSATGVTDGALVKGVKATAKGFITETLVLDSAAKVARIVRTRHLV
jgi:fructose-1,6-bisphosphatase II / sedoheptulose-1,7-bisphosphatase